MNANRIREYFTFNRKERIGIIVLLTIIAVIYALPAFWNENAGINAAEIAEFKKQIDTLQYEQQSVKKYTDTGRFVAAEPTVEKQYFYFDPNTLPAEGWKKLGIRDRTILTIQRYINKGGRFYKPEDLQKIFGLPEADYKRLVKYVRIVSDSKDAYAVKQNFSPTNKVQASRDNRIELMDINNADTAALNRLPGIGQVLAKRIIAFREKLGGFYTVHQISEVYGISDSVFQRIKKYMVCKEDAVIKINLNDASLETLKAHPYIKYQLGNAVIQYRQQHGRFRSVEELKALHLMTEDLFAKLSPYINID